MKQVMSSRMTMMMIMIMMQTLEMRRMRGPGAGRPGAKISVGSMTTDITDIGSSGTGFHMHRCTLNQSNTIPHYFSTMEY